MLLTRRQFVKLMTGAASIAAMPGMSGVTQAMAGLPIARTRPVIKYSEQELKKLRISFHQMNDGIRFFPRSMGPLFEGMKKHGLNVYWANYGKAEDSDIAVVSGWHDRAILAEYQRRNKNVLVVEMGFMQPRGDWPTLAFNGLANYGIFHAPPEDNGTRFRDNFGHLLMPWQPKHQGNVLLIGQLPVDKSLHGIDMNRWLQEVTDKLLAKKQTVMFRPHPWEVAAAQRARRPFFIPKGASLTVGSLQDNLAQARYCVNYSSTTAVESVLAGIPAVTMCEGSIAWNVTSHDLATPILMPPREQWCHALAWKQWNHQELASGMAWEYVRRAIIT